MIWFQLAGGRGPTCRRHVPGDAFDRAPSRIAGAECPARRASTGPQGPARHWRATIRLKADTTYLRGAQMKAHFSLLGV